MRRHHPGWCARDGFTLIELTVVLAVIVTLTLVLTPSITSFVNDSRAARTRADVQMLAAAAAQFYKDNAFFPQWATAYSGGPANEDAKVDLLVSPGNTPRAASNSLWLTGTTDTIASQFIANEPGYTTRTPFSTFGWNGPYLSSAIGADAWNNRYAINVGLIDTAIGTLSADGTPKNAVWVISAGPNGQIDTPYAQTTTNAAVFGDDIAVRLQ